MRRPAPAARWQRAELVRFLEETAPPTQQLYSVARSRSESGRSAYVDFYVVSGSHFIGIGPEVAQFLGRRYYDDPGGMRLASGGEEARRRLVKQLAERLYGDPHFLRHLLVV